MIFQIELTVFAVTLLAIALLFGVCGRKSVRFLLSLAATILLLLWVIVPFIAKGYNPVVVTFFGTLPVIILITYLNEGFTKLSHISIITTIFIFVIISL